MDLRFTPEEVAFRDDLRRFFRTEIPAEIRRKVAEGRHLSKEDIVASQRILNAQRLAVPHWPAAWGGRDWTPVQRYIYTEELQRAAPLGALSWPALASSGYDRRDDERSSAEGRDG